MKPRVTRQPVSVGGSERPVLRGGAGTALVSIHGGWGGASLLRAFMEGTGFRPARIAEAFPEAFVREGRAPSFELVSSRLARCEAFELPRPPRVRGPSGRCYDGTACWFWRSW